MTLTHADTQVCNSLTHGGHNNIDTGTHTIQPWHTTEPFDAGGYIILT